MRIDTDLAAHAWQGYMHRVLAADLDPDQLELYRDAFYAGMASVLTAQSTIARATENGCPDEVAGKIMQAFARDIIKGYGNKIVSKKTL